MRLIWYFIAVLLLCTFVSDRSYSQETHIPDVVLTPQAELLDIDLHLKSLSLLNKIFPRLERGYMRHAEVQVKELCGNRQFSQMDYKFYTACGTVLGNIYRARELANGLGEELESDDRIKATATMIEEFVVCVKDMFFIIVQRIAEMYKDAQNIVFDSLEGLFVGVDIQVIFNDLERSFQVALKTTSLYLDDYNQYLPQAKVVSQVTEKAGLIKELALEVTVSATDSASKLVAEGIVRGEETYSKVRTCTLDMASHLYTGTDTVLQNLTSAGKSIAENVAKKFNDMFNNPHNTFAFAIQTITVCLNDCYQAFVVIRFYYVKMDMGGMFHYWYCHLHW